MSEAVKYFSFDEIKNHNGKNGQSIWIVYKDSVFDITSFLEEHPGGEDIIEEWAGKDATKPFDDFGHSGDAKKQLKELKIGEVVEEERKSNKKKAAPKNTTTNGVTVKTAPPEKPELRSCLSVFTCGLCG